MKIGLDKDKAEEIRKIIKSQIEALDLSDYSLTIDQNEKTVFAVKQPRLSKRDEAWRWLMDRGEIFVIAIALVFVYCVVSCNSGRGAVEKHESQADSYTETTSYKRTFVLSNGKVVTNSVDVTHSVTNGNRQ